MRVEKPPTNLYSQTLKPLYLLLLLIPHLANSQTIIKGLIRDEKNNPVPYSNVYIQSDKSKAIVAYCQSDGAGTYSLKTTMTGKMWLNFSAMSFKATIIPIELTVESGIIVKNATLVNEPISLDEIIVSADKSMTIKKDTIIFNATAFATGNERVVEDLLKKIPGLIIDEKGTIKVGNREIEKVMIDGDDFFEKGYSILTRNMPAYPISKVEVYQHYSNNKLLKGIENSEKVALNLKVKEEAKRQWFGNASLGYGPEKRDNYEIYGNLMNFGKKNKFYGIASLNNIGEDATGNIRFLITPVATDEPGNIGEGQNAQSLIGISTFSPNLKQNRILFNNSGVYSLNGIFTLSSKLKMKALAYLNSDENNFYKGNFESVTVGETSFINTENHRLKSNQLTGFGKIDLTCDISKTQSLVLTGKFNQSNENMHNKLVFNDSVTNENLINNYALTDQKLLYTNRFRQILIANPLKVIPSTGSFTRISFPDPKVWTTLDKQAKIKCNLLD